MVEGVDYSFARPSPTGLVAAGKKFVGRYIGTPNSEKNLTLTEANQLRAAGLDIFAVYQTTKSFMASGTVDGATAMRAAMNDAMKCGMPADRPIYFALDVDPATLTPSEWLKVEQFLNRAAVPYGRYFVGLYGGYGAIHRLVPTYAQWGWQTYAWSHGVWSPKAHVQQYRNGVDLAGGKVDLCRSIRTDYGQWGYLTQNQEDDLGLSTEDKAWLDGRLARVASWVTTGHGNAYVTTTGAWAFSDDPGTITLNEVFAAAVDDETVDNQALATHLAPVLLATLVPALSAVLVDVASLTVEEAEEAAEAAVRRVFSDAGTSEDVEAPE